MGKVDIELGRNDIQQLSSADEIAAFFARLGYNTNRRIAQTADNLGISDEDAKRSIKRIELIADEDNFLQVYFFELTSVTMTNIRKLVRSFRNKAGNYLLVLTAEYNRLDFILIEGITPVSASDKLETRQVNVRPAILTVTRKDPSAVSLRVLRRFTYTETDPFYQYEKLLAAYSITDWSEDFFNNRALFSDYYLTQRLTKSPEWQEECKPVYIKFREICQESISRYLSERKIDILTELFESTFKELGFKFITGRTADNAGHEEPDYFLFDPDGGKDGDRPIAVALVYPWGRSLDGRDDRRDRDTPDENPCAAVVSLLEADKAPWAIVTNGRTWRLYSQKTHSRATNYYEVDLTEALSLGSPSPADPAAAFRYWWLFFRSEAFVGKTETVQGKQIDRSFLDQVLSGSAEYAKKLGERLKKRIFFEIFPHLAEGFIADIRAREGKDVELTQERLDEVFHGTLTLLYRLLFLLHAEARDLLPAREVRGYYEASIKKLKEEIAEAAGNISDDVRENISKKYRTDSDELFQRLNRLFAVIDRGDKKLNVPAYNGGLFVTNPADEDNSPEAGNARFLRDHIVPDRYIALVLHLMTRDIDDKRRDLVFIDYRSLGVRQLGWMYEGLLEFKLRVAPEKMAIIKGKKYEEVVPYKNAVRSKIIKEGRGIDARGKTILKGNVYLENDKSERKSSGSYYTPEHIVKYIVEHTVGPVLDKKLDAMRKRLREVKLQVKTINDSNKPLIPRGLEPEAEEKKKLIGRNLVDDIFDIKVIDPAMGSGHFLVQTVDFITDKFIDFLNCYPNNPVQCFIEETRETILNEMENQGISIDRHRLTDINLLKRYILQRCIYGVDLNPMAVELAKISLWLDCFTIGTPLSFLDHHLRYGNSLIGATVTDVVTGIGEQQHPVLSGALLKGIERAVSHMKLAGELPDTTGKNVDNSRREYKKATDALAPLKRVLDIYTSRWFGNEAYSTGHGKEKQLREPTREFLQSTSFQEWLRNPNTDMLSKREKEIADKASLAASNNRFFHWELEYPEIFYSSKTGSIRDADKPGNVGFDAVVGNPPWGQKGVNKDSAVSNFLSDRYNTGDGIFDLFRPFVELGIRLTKKSSSFGMILPDIILLKDYISTRKFILDNLKISFIDWWGMAFEEATIDSASIIGYRDNNPKTNSITIHVHDPLSPISHEIEQSTFYETDRYTFNLYLTKSRLEIFNQLKKFPRLDEYFEPHEGVHSGNVRKRIFVDDRLGNSCRKLYFGRGELAKYSLTWEGRYLRLSAVPEPKSGSRYANIGNHDWYEQQKLLIRRTGDHLISAVDNEGYYASNNYFLVLVKKRSELDLYGLCALINSDFMTWYFRALEPRVGRVFSELKIKHLNVFPLPLDKTSEPHAIKLNKLGFERTLLESDMKRHKLAEKQYLNKREQLDRLINAEVSNLYQVDILQ